MSKTERHLCNKIHIFEDMLLRSKNGYEIETLRNELTKMRMSLRKLQYVRESPEQGLFHFTLKTQPLL